MRLQKYMADCGIASRRKCEEIIASGNVTVNGNIVTAMGYIVQDGDYICMNGNQITSTDNKFYFAFNKPAGVLCTSSDDRGRKTVLDYFRHINARLFVVGRLDYDTEGLIFVTNDGEFANKVAHPKYKSTKVYEVVCQGYIDNSAIDMLKNGVLIDGKHTSKAEVKVSDRNNDHSKLLIKIHEGRNRQIRKMIDAVASRVLTLKRIKIGSITINGIKSGSYRQLSKDEVKFFLNK